MAYFFITNNDVDVKDMFDNKKASAYLPYSTSRVSSIIKNDLVFIYRVKIGIIAYGYSSGKNCIECQCNSGLGSSLEDHVHLDMFTPLKKVIPYSILNILYKKYSTKALVLGTTVKLINDDFANEIIREIKR